MSRHVILFTPFPPGLGGGSTILRSLVPHLDAFRIDWRYTALKDENYPGAACIGPPMSGGSLVRDLTRGLALWSGLWKRNLRRVVTALEADRPAGYWVVGHNEGVLVARALARRGARVHLTIHDDVPDGVLGRSVRYRHLAGLARPAYHAALRSAYSRDFITERMRQHYQATVGVSGEVIRPFIAALPEPALPSTTRRPGEILVGHIGTIYSVPEWRAFLQAFIARARQRSLAAKMVMVGLASKFHRVAREFPGVVELVPDMPEPQAVERLMAADLLYAMYPFDPRADVFRRTSLPTKLSTYVRCRRPIFAHTPRETSLADLVEAHGLGRVCDTLSPSGIEATLESALGLSIRADRFEEAREIVYGAVNIRRMSACLDGLVSPVQSPVP